MPIRMIVTDLDGTLLQTDSTISPYTMSVLDHCRNQGGIIVLATGRAEKGTECYIEQVRPHAVISNGGALLRYRGQILYRRMLPMAVTDQLIQECLSSPDIGRITVETEAGFYWDSRYFTHEENYLHATSYDFREPMGSAAYKITVEIFNYTTAAALADRYEEAGMTPFAGEDWYQYSHRDANKMYAVKALADHLRINLSQAAAFGNDYNDIEMLAGCGMGVAVSNAIPEVRQAADHVTASNDDDGVARFLDRMMAEGTVC